MTILAIDLIFSGVDLMGKRNRLIGLIPLGIAHFARLNYGHVGDNAENCQS
jgi:hypothetical protein